MPTLPQEALQFCGPTYLSASPVLDAQRSINLYPEPQYKSSKTAMALIGRPGMSAARWSLPSSPVRSIWAGNNVLYAVGGASFYQLDNTGGIIYNFGVMAGSTGAGKCQISHNGTQLLVMDPTAGKIFYADPVSSTMIPVFNGVALEYLDGFYVAIATGASLAGSNPNQINVSGFLNGGSWDSSDVVLRTASSDLTTALAVLNGQLWIFGQSTIEIWYNAGNANFPFARVSGATINLGLLSPQTVVKFSNTIMWLAADANGYAQVFMANGLNPVRVSNAAIEGLLASLAGTGILRNAHFAYGYQENGHTFYVLNIANVQGVTVITLVYDLTTGLWHERSYTQALPCSFASLPGFWQGLSVAHSANFVGDLFSGSIYFQSIYEPNDAGTAITYTRTAPHVSNQNRAINYTRFELDGDFGTGAGAHACAPVLDYSNDGGRTFLSINRDLQQSQDMSYPSTFKRYYATELGSSRDRVFKVSITDDTNLIRIANAYVDVAPGDET